jgi:hypothetical protein
MPQEHRTTVWEAMEGMWQRAREKTRGTAAATTAELAELAGPQAAAWVAVRATVRVAVLAAAQDIGWTAAHAAAQATARGGSFLIKLTRFACQGKVGIAISVQPQLD